MLTKTTPGPWKADIRGGCLAVYPASEEHNCLSGAEEWAIHYSDRDASFNSGRWSMSEEACANAHLIAAAPALAEALEAMLAHVEGRAGFSTAYHKAKAALAAAKGEER
jgi:hypothetical protein